jgi:hypothetical protein
VAWLWRKSGLVEEPCESQEDLSCGGCQACLYLDSRLLSALGYWGLILSHQHFLFIYTDVLLPYLCLDSSTIYCINEIQFLNMLWNILCTE